LILEYVPLGNLERLLPITDQETLAVLRQSLDALTSVHEVDIVHRDVKPENILVHSRDPMHIKLSDFGLSKATANLETFCGTHIYAAPEIYDRPRVAYYTSAIDIWSLGVVIILCALGLPVFQEEDMGLGWCNKIITLLDNWHSDPLLGFVSSAMVITDPERRHSARSCWEQARKLPAPSGSRCPTPTQASYGMDMRRIGNNAGEKQVAESRTESSVDHYLRSHMPKEQGLKDQQNLVNSSHCSSFNNKLINEGGDSQGIEDKAKDAI
jgi:serine/threonine protein kinase